MLPPSLIQFLRDTSPLLLFLLFLAPFIYFISRTPAEAAALLRPIAAYEALKNL